MNKNLDRLLNDQICELVCYRIGQEHSTTCKIGFTEEMLSKINRGIAIHRETPDLVEMMFTLDSKIKSSLLCDYKQEELDSRCSEYISAETDIPSFEWQEQKNDSDLDFLRVEFEMVKGKWVGLVHVFFSNNLNFFCYIDSNPSYKPTKTLREVLAPFDVKIEKVTYE